MFDEPESCFRDVGRSGRLLHYVNGHVAGRQPF
jgi:hypothetical protein